MNTMTAKPTPGPYYLAGDDATDCPMHKNSGLALIDTGREFDFTIARLMEWNNAKFLHDALTVYHETGLTPRQLADQRAELMAALEECSSELEAEVEAKFNAVKRHPGMLHHYERDINSVKRAKALIDRAKAVQK